MKPRRTVRCLRLLLRLLLLLGLLTSCAPAPTATPVPTPTPFASGKVDIGGGRQLMCRCLGQGSPTVVIEAGGGVAGSSGRSWDEVMAGVATVTRICVYDRMGLGTSTKAPGPRTSADVAADLHALLSKAGIPVPYVLVGHSFGGLHVRVYRARYPAEVAGMVLVEASHPETWASILALLPPASAGESAALTRYREFIASFSTDSAGQKMDGIDIPSSLAQARESGSLGDLPLVVIARSPTPAVQDLSTPVEVRDAENALWQDQQAQLARLSTNGKLIVATRAGHMVNTDEPQLVIDAILAVVDQARRRP